MRRVVQPLQTWLVQRFAPPRTVIIGGRVDRVRVSFRLTGDALNPAQVTASLGLPPTRANARGELSPPGKRTGRLFRRPTGVWLLTSPLPQRAPLDAHLRHLLDTLTPQAAAIRQFTGEGLTAEFYCGCFVDAFNRGTGVPPEVLRGIADLNAELSLDIYCTGDAPTLANVAAHWWWTLVDTGRRWLRMLH